MTQDKAPTPAANPSTEQPQPAPADTAGAAVPAAPTDAELSAGKLDEVSGGVQYLKNYRNPFDTPF